MTSIRLNGELTQCSETTIAELVAARGLSDKRIAIECNGLIVPKSRYAVTRLAAGDTLEIVVAVGGG